MNRRLERGVLAQAGTVTAANPRLTNLLASKLRESTPAKCVTITNGYDKEDVRPPVDRSSRFYISYFGTIYEKGFPVELFEAVAECVKNNPAIAASITFRVAGNIHPAIRDRLQKMIPSSNLEWRGYLLHDELMHLIHEQQVLILMINQFPGNEATVPGKLYEYLPTGNPILGWGPVPGDASDILILNETHAGSMFNMGDQRKIRFFIEKHYQNWREQKQREGGRLFARYDRERLTGRLAGVFNDLIQG